MKKIRLYDELNKLIEYIEDNLTNIESIESCSRVTFLSKYHLLHTFKAITGYTLKDYIQRRRLAESLFDLRNTDYRLIDVAMKYGFNHEQSYIRAFKRVYSMTPNKFRKSDESVLISHPIELKNFLYVADGIIFDPVYVHLNGICLTGVKTSIKGNESYTKGTAKNVGHDFFFNKRHEITNTEHPLVYIGHTWHDYGETHDSYYLSALETTSLRQVPNGMISKYLPPANYIHFKYIGNHSVEELTLHHLMAIHNYVTFTYPEADRLFTEPFFFEKIDIEKSREDYIEVELYFRIKEEI